MKHKFIIQQFLSLPSTNDYAKMHYQEVEDRTVILCDVQTNGRGRFDRVWESGKDLTFSILFRESAPFALLIPLSIIHALATFHIEGKIKWPNDILVQDKKVCGILIEKIYSGNEFVAQVAGIGVNLSTPSSALQDKAGYLEIDNTLLLHEILSQFEQLEILDLQQILTQYRQFHYLQGRKILLNDVLWNVVDINEDGGLIIQCASDTRILTSEEISLQHIY